MQKEYTLKTPTREYFVKAEVEQSITGLHLSISIKKDKEDDGKLCINTFLSSVDIIQSALEEAIPKEKGFYELRMGGISIVLSYYTAVLKALSYQIQVFISSYAQPTKNIIRN